MFRPNHSNFHVDTGSVPRRLCANALLFSTVILNPSVFEGATTWREIGTVSQAYARNLPTNNGAVGDRRGTVDALVPLLRLQKAVAASVNCVRTNEDLKECKGTLQSIPRDEKDFKKLFDEYSVDISYKQKYLDQNAFLVYYTKGFDGLGRESIEKEDDQMKLQVRQYGARNDAWVAVDEARAELDYLLTQSAGESTRDLQAALSNGLKALDDYLSLAPSDQVTMAAKLVGQDTK